MTNYVNWLKGLAEKGGKGVVNNIDARCLGRVADELLRLQEYAGDLKRQRDDNICCTANNEAAYRCALLWAFDRLGVDDMTMAERVGTKREIGKVLTGKVSPAATYFPNYWDDSVTVLKSETV